MLKNMYSFWNYIKETTKDKKGQGMVEYALIIGLVAVLLIAGLQALQVDISGIFTQITTAL